jgi:hypothetical protein
VILNIGGALKDAGFNLANAYLGIYNGISSWTYYKNKSQNTGITAQIPDNNSWVHLLTTRDNDSIKLYVDGIQISSAATGDLAEYSGSNKGIYLGCRIGNTNYFNGAIDDIRIWKRTLSTSEISSVYNEFATSFQAASLANSLLVYPNPNQGSFKIELANQVEFETLNFYDATGKNITSLFFTNLENNDVHIETAYKGLVFIKGVGYSQKILIK